MQRRQERRIMKNDERKEKKKLVFLPSREDFVEKNIEQH